MDFLEKQKASQLKLIIGTCYTVLAVILLFVLVTLFQDTIIWPMLLVSVPTAYTYYLAKFQNRLTLASHLLVANTSLLISFYIYAEGGMYAPTVVLSLTPGILAMVLLGGKAGMNWFIASTLMNVFAVYLSSLIGFENRLSPQDIFIGVQSGILLGSAGIFVVLKIQDRHNQELREVLMAQNKDFEQLTDSLMGAIKDKQALVTVVCHDLATPVTTLQTNLELLDMHTAREDLNIQQKECLQRLQRATSTIHEIVSFTRTMMSTNFGKLDVTLSKVYLPEIILSLKDLYQDRIEHKDIDFKFDNELLDNAWILAEERSLTYSVIGNIISNSIKFSSKGGSLFLRIFERDDQVVLSLRDKGPGIKPSLLVNLFSWDTVVSRKGTFGEEGSGFGMPACLSWMKSYDGSITVHSRFLATKEESHHDKRSECLIDQDDVKAFAVVVLDACESGTTFELTFKPYR